MPSKWSKMAQTAGTEARERWIMGHKMGSRARMQGMWIGSPYKGPQNNAHPKGRLSPTFWASLLFYGPLSLSTTPFPPIFSSSHTLSCMKKFEINKEAYLSHAISCYSELSSTSTRWYAHVLSSGSLWCFHPWLHLLAYCLFFIIMLVTAY